MQIQANKNNIKRLLFQYYFYILFLQCVGTYQHSIQYILRNMYKISFLKEKR